jgi:hypothetical protein
MMVLQLLQKFVEQIFSDIKIGLMYAYQIWN